jgi:hypothetical protein
VQALHKSGDPLALNQGRGRAQEPDGRQFAWLLRAGRERPSDRGAEKRDKLAPFQLIELHMIPASQGRIAGYQIGEDQSGGIRAFAVEEEYGSPAHLLKKRRQPASGSAFFRSSA